MKNPTSFRLADDALTVIRELAQIQGGSQSEAIEYLAREWKKAHATDVLGARLERVEETLAWQTRVLKDLGRQLENKVDKPGDW